MKSVAGDERGIDACKADLYYSVKRLLRTIERNPPAAFTIFVFVHVALWTIVPALLQRNCSSAIEGVAYGRDWQLGCWKHPPLPWLLMDLTHQVFGTWLWPFFLLGQLATAVAFWAPWRLGRELFTPLEAFVAVVILDGNIEYSFNTTAFNHHILELPFFALLLVAVHNIDRVVDVQDMDFAELRPQSPLAPA